MALAAIFIFSAPKVLAAETSVTFQGDLPNDGVNYVIRVYDAAEGDPCPGAGALGSDTKLGDATYNATNENDYSITFDTTDADAYVYFCSGNASGSLLLSYGPVTVATGTTYQINLGRIDGTSIDAGLDNDYVGVCSALGGTLISTKEIQISGVTHDYTQYYPIDCGAAGASCPASVYVLFDQNNAGICTLDADKSSGKKITIAAAENYGVYLTFAPDTVVAAQANHADINTKWLNVNNTTSGLDTGMTGAIAAGTYTLYYDNPTVATLSMYLRSGNAGDIFESITPLANGFTTQKVDRKISGSIPTDITEVKEVIGGITYSTSAFTDDAGHHNYALYIPSDAGAQDLVFMKGAAVVYTEVALDADLGDAVVNVGKASGSTHASLQTGTDTIEVATDNKCTTLVSTVASNPSGADPNYEVYFVDGGGGHFYLKMTTAAGYVSCGNHFALTDEAATVSPTVLVSGTRHADNAAILVDNDKGGTLTNGDVYTDTFVGDDYRIYTAVDATSQVVVDNTNNTFANIVLTTVTEKDFSTDAVISVAKVTGNDANINDDLLNGAGGATNDSIMTTVASADGTGTNLASIAGVIDSNDDDHVTQDTYSSYFEVPVGGLVNFEIQDGDAANAVVAYAYNVATVGATTYTFEPEDMVAATVPATVLGFEVQKGDSTGYIMRDNTATFTIYKDHAEGAGDPHYNYRAYTDDAFTALVLDRGEKHVADTTFGVNTVTNTAIHADLNNDVDPVDVYTSAGTTADCSTTLRSSDTTQVWANGSMKYYEANAGQNINLKITDGANVACVNTLIAAAAAGGDDAYDLDIKTSGNVNADVVTVYIDANQAGGDDISAPVAGGAYAIYWAGDPASNVTFYDVGPALLLAINGRSLAIDTAVNVAKVSGNVSADATSIGVHAAADCSGAALNSADVDTDPAYSRYFEGVDGGSYYMKVADATTFTCRTTALTVAGQAATANFDYKLSGTVPDVDATTLKILSVAIADIANYWSDTINPGTTDYVAYIAGGGSTGILFKTAVSGGGVSLLQVNKAVAADTVVNVSAANGNAHADIDSVVAVCEAPQTSNATCDTKYSTVAPADAATYEIFFEEQGAPGNYYLEVLDTDTEDYYSWNKFTTAGTAGSYVAVELDGKLSGVTAEAFAPATMVPGVLIGLATNGSIFPANEVSRTYSYTDVDPFAAPSGNYRMYANDGTTYDGVGSKSGYITNTTDGVDLVPTAAGLTKNWAMTTGIKVTVRDQGANPITNATVSVYTCTTNDPATCTTAAVTCLNPAGACNRAGDGSAGNGLNGEYNFSGLAAGTYVQFRVSLATFGDVHSPTLDEAVNSFVISDSAQVAGVVMMVAANPGAVSLTINSGAGYTTNPAVTLALNPNATDAVWMAFSCNSSTWSVDETYAASASFNVNTGAGCAVGDGLKTVYVRVKNSSGNASYASDTITLATAPTVIDQYPLDEGELGVFEFPAVTFSEAMDLGTINTATIQLRDFATDAPVSYTFVEPDAVTANKFIIKGWTWTYGQHYYLWVSGVKNLAGVVVTDYTTKENNDFTTAAYTATLPTIESWTPGAGNSIGINVTPQENVISVTFDQRIYEADIDTANFKLLDSDDTNIPLSMLAYGLVGGKTVVTIMPAAPLTYGTDYHITVQDVRDYLHGDTIVDWDSEIDGGGLFSTIAQPNGSLAVTSTAQVKSWALADGYWPNGNGAGTGGWTWSMMVTVPVNETFVRMKFANWTGAAGASIPAAANIRYHSHQAVDASPLTVNAASTYGNSMQINPALDMNASQDGVQIEVTIESKIPIGSTAGAYSTSYGIESNAVNPD